MPRASAAIEMEIATVEDRLFAIRDEVAQWSDAAANLSLDAADQRARNGEMGRGLGGALFGAKYRAVARRAAASNNAAIAREVATKRQGIAHAKQRLREEERDLRYRLRDLKADLRDAKACDRDAQRAARATTRAVVTPAGAATVRTAPADPTSLKDELRRLKLLHQQGALDALAYEQARIALLQPHLRA